MSVKSFTHIFLSLAFVALTTTLVIHHHYHNIKSSVVDAKCTLCFVASTTVADGCSQVVSVDVVTAIPKIIFKLQSVSYEPFLFLKARDPPCGQSV